MFILLECTEKKNLFYERKLTIISSNHLVKHCYNRASKFVSSNLIARACFIFLLSTLMTSANVSLEKKIFHRVENVIKQLVHTSAVRSSRYEARGKFREHLRQLLECSPNFPSFSKLPKFPRNVFFSLGTSRGYLSSAKESWFMQSSIFPLLF